MKRFAILGHLVSHSLSPKLHNAVFQAMGLKDHVYEFYDCPPEKLKDAIQEMRDGKWEGFSVTIPHKQTMIPLLDGLSQTAKKIGAVNVVMRRDDGILFGDNTDYAGFRKSLEESKVEKGHALVLGFGGAALAVIAVLKDLEFEVTVASRSSKDGTVSYDQLDPDEDYSLIVNTTPVGMVGMKNEKGKSENEKNDHLLSDSRWYRSDRYYFDVVYTPKITPFLQRAQDVGAKIITGDRMFFWQAVEQAKIFTGRDDVPVEVMEKVLNREL